MTHHHAHSHSINTIPMMMHHPARTMFVLFMIITLLIMITSTATITIATTTTTTCSPFQLRYQNESCSPALNQHCAPFLDCIDHTCTQWNNLLSLLPPSSSSSSSTAAAAATSLHRIVSDPSTCYSHGLTPITINQTLYCTRARFIGDDCTSNSQCQFGVCSTSSSSSSSSRTNKCINKPLNSSCQRYLNSNECGVSMYCSRDLTCQHRNTLGESCQTLDDGSQVTKDPSVGSCRRDLTCVTRGVGSTGQGTCQQRADVKSECNSFGYGAPTCKLPFYCPSDVFDIGRKFTCQSNLVALKEKESCEFDPYFKIQNREVCGFGLSCNITSSTCQKKHSCSDSSNNCFSGATHQYLTSYCNCKADNPDAEGTCAIYEQGCKFTNADVANIRACVVDKCYGGSDSDFPYTTETLTRVMFDSAACPFKKCAQTIEPYYCCLINQHKVSPKFTLPYGTDEHFFIDQFCKPKEDIKPLGIVWLMIGVGIVSVAILNVIVATCLVYQTKQPPMINTNLDLSARK